MEPSKQKSIAEELDRWRLVKAHHHDPHHGTPITITMPLQDGGGSEQEARGYPDTIRLLEPPIWLLRTRVQYCGVPCTSGGWRSPKFARTSESGGAQHLSPNHLSCFREAAARMESGRGLREVIPNQSVAAQVGGSKPAIFHHIQRRTFYHRLRCGSSQ